MSACLRKPEFWLAIQVLVLGSVLGLRGKFQPVWQPDTASYVEFPFDSLADALSQPRTFGYPLFLRSVSWLAPSYAAAPLFHYAIHVAAVAVFYAALREMLRNPWARMIVASSLLYSNVLLRYLSTLTADALASSLAIIAVSLLIMTVAGRPRRGLLWAGLTAALFATYQTRPAYLFLPLLAPFLGLGLKALFDGRNRGQDPHSRNTPQAGPATGSRPLFLRTGIALCLASILPLLAFCCLRWIVVGQFSLVSFGGHNFAGLVGQFLDDDLAAELPPEVRPLAKASLARQRSLTPNEPLRFGGPRLSYSAIENRWDRMTWSVFVPAANELHLGDKQQVNSRLRDLAIAIVRARPRLYAVWLAKAFLQGARLIVAEIILNPVYFLLIACLLAAHAGHVMQRLRRPTDSERILEPLRRPSVSRFGGVGDPRRAQFLDRLLAGVDAEYFTALNSLLLTAVSFAAAKLMLVVATTPPQGRFMDAAGVFLPMVIAAALADRLQRIWACRIQKEKREIFDGGGP